MTQASVQQATHEDLLYGMVAGPAPSIAKGICKGTGTGTFKNP